MKRILKYVFAALFIAGGANHFINPAFYVNIMPAYLPAPLLLVQVSGAFELLFGVMLLLRRWRVIAAWGLILLLIAIFPANLYMAMNPQLYAEINPAVLWLRLPLQGVLVAWAYWYTRPSATAG